MLILLAISTISGTAVSYSFPLSIYGPVPCCLHDGRLAVIVNILASSLLLLPQFSRMGLLKGAFSRHR